MTCSEAVTAVIGDRVRDLLVDPTWLDVHAGRVAKRGRANRHDREDLRSEGALWCLETLATKNFDLSRFPMREGESPEAHRARVQEGLKAFAGISIIRFLTKRQVRARKLLTVENETLDGVGSRRQEVAFSQRAEARDELRRFRAEAEILPPGAEKVEIVSTIDRILAGEDFDEVLSGRGPIRRWKNLMKWAGRFGVMARPAKVREDVTLRDPDVGTASTPVSAPLDPLAQVQALSTEGVPAVSAGSGVIAVDSVVQIPTAEIHSWDITARTRTEVDEEEMAALRANIAEHGITTPLWVVRAESGYLLIAGYRRFACARSLGLATIPCIVREIATEDEGRMLSAIENSARADLSDLDSLRMVSWAAGAYSDRVLHEGKGQQAAGRFNVTAVAALFGRSPHWSRTRCRTLEIYSWGEIEALDAVVKRHVADPSIPTQQRLTWHRIMSAATDIGANGYRDAILGLAGISASGDAATAAPVVAPEKATRDPRKEVYVPVKCEALDGNRLSLKLGSAVGRSATSVTVRAVLEMPFKIGTTGFTQGERGLQRTAALFRDLGKHFENLAVLASKETPTEEEIAQFTAIRESLDRAASKLVSKVRAKDTMATETPNDAAPVAAAVEGSDDAGADEGTVSTEG